MTPVSLADILLELDSGGRPQGGANGLAEGVASIGAEHLDGSGGFNLSNTRWIPEEFYDQMSKGQVRRGNILIVKDGATTGKTSYVDERFPFERAAVNEHVFRLAVQPRCADSAYVFHYLASPRGQREILKDFRGATVGGISRGFASKVCVPLPYPDDPKRSLAEQKRLAAILDQADALLRRRHEAARLTDQLIPSLFYEMFGDPAKNPKAFPVRSFNEVIAETQYGTAEKANSDHRGAPILRMNNITVDGAFDLSDLKWIELGAGETDQYTVQPGDLLFNRTNSRELVGKNAVWQQAERFAFAGYLIRVRFQADAVTADYVSAFLNSPYGKQMLYSRAQPSINMSNISASMLRRMSLPVPPLSLQREFGKQLIRIHELQASHETKRQEAENLFNSLVQRAFRGEL